MSSTKPFSYEIDPNYDYILEERGNTYTALRKIRWGNSDTFKLDLRKYYATEDGEIMSKGHSMMSDEGSDELTRVLVDTGYGNDKKLFDAIVQNRPQLFARFVNEVNEMDEFTKKRYLDEYEKIKDEDDFQEYDLEDVI